MLRVNAQLNVQTDKVKAKALPLDSFLIINCSNILLIMEFFTTVFNVYTTKFDVKYARKSYANTPKTVVFYY